MQQELLYNMTHISPLCIQSDKALPLWPGKAKGHENPGAPPPHPEVPHIDAASDEGRKLDLAAHQRRAHDLIG